eukprot:9138130-Karenia_brevis.AAC.1
MDEVLIQSWATVYLGNSSDVMGTVANFMCRFCSFLFLSSSFHLDPLTVDDLKMTIAEGSNSAAGLDGFSPADFKLFSDNILTWLVRLLDLVEGGAPWPQGLLHAKGSLLSKDAGSPYEPLAYRVLLIMATLYRKWACTRLRHLGPWIDAWKLESMFAGVGQVGAQEAWYDAALNLEHAKVYQQPATGGAVDIHKCFDQILRPLLYWLLLIAGFPKQVTWGGGTHTHVVYPRAVP